MNNRSTIKQIFINTFTGWGALCIRAVIALVMVPFLLGHLGKEGYGLIGVMGVILSLTQVADLGLRSALGRELSEKVTAQDRNALGELLTTAFAVYLSIALVLAALIFFLAPYLVPVFKIQSSLSGEAVFLIRFYGVASILMSFITPVFSSALSGYHRFDLINLAQIWSSLLSNLLLFIVLPILVEPLWGWVIIMLIGQLLYLVASLTMYWRIFGRELDKGCFKINISRISPLFRLGGMMYFLQISQALSEKSDPLVISYFFGPLGVAQYLPGGKLSSMVRPIVLTLADQMYPLATRHHVHGRQDKMQKILFSGTKFTLLLGILFSTGLLVFSEPFCHLWLGRSLGDDYKTASLVMMGWAIADLLTYAGGTQWAIMLAQKRLKFAVLIQLPLSILNILASIYLIGFSSLGIPGALVATILTGMIRRPLIAIYAARCCGVRFFKYVAEAYIRPIISFFLTLSGAILFRCWQTMDTYLAIFMASVLTFCVWFVSVYFVGLNSIERQAIRVAIKGRLKSVS